MLIKLPYHDSHFWIDPTKIAAIESSRDGKECIITIPGAVSGESTDFGSSLRCAMSQDECANLINSHCKNRTTGCCCSDQDCDRGHDLSV
jgi:hypothetical protein